MTEIAVDMTTAGHREDEHAQVHNRPEYDDVNVPVVLMVGLISAIVTVCIIFFVQGLYYQWQNSYLTDRSLDVVDWSVVDTVKQQKSLLEGVQEGTIPIEDSMEKVIAQYGKKSD